MGLQLKNDGSDTTNTMTQEQKDYIEETNEYEKAGEDFQADFSLEDTQVPDHPVVVDVEGMGKGSAYLAAWELVEEMQEGGDEYVIDADEVARIVRTHYVSPSFDGLRGEKVRSMKLSVPDSLLGAIMPGMETQMNPDGSARVDTKN